MFRSKGERLPIGSRTEPEWFPVDRTERVADGMRATSAVAVVAASATATLASAREVVIDCDDRKSSYDMPLAIISVFVIFVVSVAGFMLPAYFNTKANRSFRFGVTLCTFLSYSVLLTVGFVHILGDAQLFLSNPCLPEGFLKAYPCWATLICVIAIFVSILLDFYGHSYLANLVKIGTKDRESEMVPINESTQRSDGLAPVPMENGDAELLEDVFEGEIPSEASLDVKRAAVTFIEVSVCTHSIPVGLALGLENAENFVSLFIAIIFHQVSTGDSFDHRLPFALTIAAADSLPFCSFCEGARRVRYRSGGGGCSVPLEESRDACWVFWHHGTPRHCHRDRLASFFEPEQFGLLDWFGFHQCVCWRIVDLRGVRAHERLSFQREMAALPILADTSDLRGCICGDWSADAGGWQICMTTSPSCLVSTSSCPPFPLSSWKRSWQ